MRILMLTTYFPPDSSANGILMRQLAEDLQTAGHLVTVLTSLPHYDGNGMSEGYRGKVWMKEWVDKIRVYRTYLYVPKRKRSIPGRIVNYLTWNLSSFLAGLFTGQQDMLFVPSPPLSNGIVASLIARIRRIPFVYSVQDIYPDIAVRLDVLRGEIMIRFFKSMERSIYSRANDITVISEGFRLNLLSKGVAEDKIHVIPNFADTEHIRPMPRRNAFSANHSLGDRFVVLFAGNVGLSQGLDSILDTADLLGDRPDILFLLVGNGVAKPALLDHVERLGLRNVVFHPFHPYRNVPEMYASADVCLVPLKRGISKASVPSKIYSILAAARPVIASIEEDSDTWRLVREAKCGLCIPPEDPQAMSGAVIRLYNDRDLGKIMGANGRAYVEEHYSRKRISREYEKLFMNVAGKGAPSGR